MPATLIARQFRCRCVQKPIAPCTLCPDGYPGVVEIQGDTYLVRYHNEGEEIAGIRLVKIGAGGAPYDIGPDGLCDCADCTFRERECKHMVALGQLIERGEIARFTS